MSGKRAAHPTDSGSDSEKDDDGPAPVVRAPAPIDRSAPRFVHIIHHLCNPNNRSDNADWVRNVGGRKTVNNATVIRVYNRGDSRKRRESNFACTQVLKFQTDATGSGSGNTLTGYLWSALPFYTYSFVFGIRQFGGRSQKRVTAMIQVTRKPLTRMLILQLWRSEFGSSRGASKVEARLIAAMETAGLSNETQVVPLALWAKAVGKDLEGTARSPCDAADVAGPANADDKAASACLPSAGGARAAATADRAGPLREIWRDMADNSIEVRKYFYMEELDELSTLWSLRDLLLLTGAELSWRVHTLHTQPWILCFFPLHHQEIEQPGGGTSKWFPDLSYNDLVRVTDQYKLPHNHAAENAAYLYQAKLRPDVHGDHDNNGGHMYSDARPMRRSPRAYLSHNYHGDLDPDARLLSALSFMVQHGIVVQDGEKDCDIYLTPVWRVQQRIVDCLLDGVVANAMRGMRPPLKGEAPFNKNRVLEEGNGDDKGVTEPWKPAVIRPLPPELDCCYEQLVFEQACVNQPIVIASGKAGSGKTAAVHAWMLRNTDAHGVAVVSFTNKVVSDWRSKIISPGRAFTCHKFVMLMQNPSAASAMQLDHLYVLVFEELSMIDAELFSEVLYWALRCNPRTLCRVVCIGDISQLEAIRYGDVLRGLATALPWAFVRFRHNHRVAPESAPIFVNSNLVRAARPGSEQPPNLVWTPTFHFVASCGDIEADTARALAYAARCKYSEKDIQVLTFNRRGRGEEPANRAFKRHYRKMPEEDIKRGGVYHADSRVMVTKNFYDWQLYTGMMFTVLRVEIMSLERIVAILNKEIERADGREIPNAYATVATILDTQDQKAHAEAKRPRVASRSVLPAQAVTSTAQFLASGGDAERAAATGMVGAASRRVNVNDRRLTLTVIPFPPSLNNGAPVERLIDTVEIPLESLTDGYAVTGHKAQGGQFPCVVYIPGDSNYVNQRHMYTCITRAISQVIVVGSTKENFAAMAVRMAFPRRSRLAQKLRTAWEVRLAGPIATARADAGFMAMEMAPEAIFGDTRERMLWPPLADERADGDDAAQLDFLREAFRNMGVAVDEAALTLDM